MDLWRTEPSPRGNFVPEVEVKIEEPLCIVCGVSLVSSDCVPLERPLNGSGLPAKDFLGVHCILLPSLFASGGSVVCGGCFGLLNECDRLSVCLEAAVSELKTKHRDFYACRAAAPAPVFRASTDFTEREDVKVPVQDLLVDSSPDGGVPEQDPVGTEGTAETRTPGSASQRFPCPFCVKTYCSTRRLEVHVQKVHPDSNAAGAAGWGKSPPCNENGGDDDYVPDVSMDDDDEVSAENSSDEDFEVRKQPARRSARGRRPAKRATSGRCPGRPPKRPSPLTSVEAAATAAMAGSSSKSCEEESAPTKKRRGRPPSSRKAAPEPSDDLSARSVEEVATIEGGEDSRLSSESAGDENETASAGEDAAAAAAPEKTEKPKRKWRPRTEKKCKHCQNMLPYATPEDVRQYKAHRIAHYKEMRRKFECQVCSEKFQYKTSLFTHLTREHGYEKPFGCPQCDKRFFTEATRDKHVDSFHFDKPPDPECLCDCCGKYFSTKQSLEQHRLKKGSDRSGVCDVCGAWTRNVYIHRFLKHSERGKKALKKRRSDKDLPMDITGRRNGNMRQPGTGTPRNRPGLKCDYCPQVFYCRRKKIRHMASKHDFKPAEEDIFRCNYCDKEYYVKEDLRDHANKHMGVRMSCTECSFSTHNRANLRLHIRMLHELPRARGVLPLDPNVLPPEVAKEILDKEVGPRGEGVGEVEPEPAVGSGTT